MKRKDVFIVTKIIILIILFIGFIRCGKFTSHKGSSKITIVYPYDSCYFPPEIVAPTFEWEDTNELVNRWEISFKIKRKTIDNIITRERKWRPDRELWEQIKLNSQEKVMRIQVRGFNKEKPRKMLSENSVNFFTSKDSVNAPIFYRTVTLPFGFAVRNVETISWRLGDISSEGPPPAVLENLPVCGNCHSFSSDAKVFGMDVDYGNDKGSYVISEVEKEIELTKDKIITWSEYKKKDGEQTFGLLSQVSPNGRYVVSTVKDRSIFVEVDDFSYSQLFFPVKGILAIYDRETDKFWALPGANDPAYVQSNPSWSPDGESIIFARSETFHIPGIEDYKTVLLDPALAEDFLNGTKNFKFDLYKIPFNDGKGGKAEPISGASNNDMSNYFAKYSPDGKWLVFTQAENFMLLQPDSRLYIMSVEGGEPRKMSCNLSNMNSWHSWSPNGKWLVFTSKERGPYSQLYITHIDENGNDTPPVLLDNLSVEKLAINIPEFVNSKQKSIEKITEKFMDSRHYYLLNGINKSKTGDYKAAVELYNKSIAYKPGFKGYYNRGVAMDKLGELEKAISDYTVALTYEENFDAYYNRALIKSKQGDLDGAIGDYSQAIKVESNYEAFVNRGIVKGRLSKFVAAVKDFNEAIKMDMDNMIAYSNRAFAFYSMEKYSEAIDDYNHILSYDTQNMEAVYYRGICQRELKNYESAVDDFTKVITANPNGMAYYYRGLTYIDQNKTNEACIDFIQAQEYGIVEVEAELKEYCRN